MLSRAGHGFAAILQVLLRGAVTKRCAIFAAAVPACRHLAMSREIGYLRGVAFALGNLGCLQREAGEIAPARENLLGSLEISEKNGFRPIAAATHLALGALDVGRGETEDGRASLVVARDIAAETDDPGIETLARCHLAGLPGGDPRDAIAAFSEHEPRLDAEERLEAHWLLFRATGDRVHLEAAKRRLDAALADVDGTTRESMLENLRPHRDIAAAWDERRGHP